MDIAILLQFDKVSQCGVLPAFELDVQLWYNGLLDYAVTTLYWTQRRIERENAG